MYEGFSVSHPTQQAPSPSGISNALPEFSGVEERQDKEVGLSPPIQLSDYLTNDCERDMEIWRNQWSVA
jgi:hypothetical protein